MPCEPAAPRTWVRVPLTFMTAGLPLSPGHRGCISGASFTGQKVPLKPELQVSLTVSLAESTNSWGAAQAVWLVGLPASGTSVVGSAMGLAVAFFFSASMATSPDSSPMSTSSKSAKPSSTFSAASSITRLALLASTVSTVYQLPPTHTSTSAASWTVLLNITHCGREWGRGEGVA